jgi:hypothetical protein
MNWTAISSIFLVATFKFMFSPFAGPHLGLPFIETYFAAFVGGSFSAAIFYFASDYFMELSHKRKIEKEKILIEKGTPLPVKKKFTKTNRFVIRLKMKLGKYGICFFAPFLFSVPIGSIIVAKFYGKLKESYPLIVLGMALNAVVTTFLAYAVFG